MERCADLQKAVQEVPPKELSVCDSPFTSKSILIYIKIVDPVLCHIF